jgi:hypothetical protein
MALILSTVVAVVVAQRAKLILGKTYSATAAPALLASAESPSALHRDARPLPRRRRRS